jgi:hypothetical protein
MSSELEQLRQEAEQLFHQHARKPNLEFFSIYSNKFFNNIHLSECRFTCTELRASLS